ncbi:MAG TPA: TonB-dependent receptor [Vicinamibacterales bacterium]
MITRFSTAFVLSLVVCTSVLAQSPLNGTVRDTTGAPVPGATVTIRTDSGVAVTTVVTDAKGEFVVPNLASQRYAISASLPGFSVARRTLERPGVMRVDLTLHPEGLSEAVTVVGTELVGSEAVLRRTPGSYDLLRRADLEATHVFTSSEALRKLPGVAVRDEEGLGLRPNIGLRGLNPTRSSKVLLLEDGLPVTYAPYGDNASYYHPPVERFDRIEVLKGSSQIAYGPVTLGGVVNYITPAAPDRRSLSLDLTAGNRSYANAGIAGGGRWGTAGLFGHATRKQADGSRDNIHATLTDVLAKSTWRFATAHDFTLKANYYDENSQVTYSGLREAEYRANPRQNPFADDHFDGRRAGASASHQALLWSRVAASLQAYGSTFSRDWWRQSSNSAQRPNDAADPLCGGMNNLSTTCGNEGRLRDYVHAGIEARGRLMFAGRTTNETDFGVRLHVEQQDRIQRNGETPAARTGVVVEDNERTTDAWSAFMQHKLTGGAWTIVPGVRIERIDYSRHNRLAGVSGSTRLTEVVPGLGVSFAPAADVTVFGGIHRGFAPPRVEDIINNSTGGSVDLDPERSWNYEGGIRGRARGVHASLTAFRMDYENQIVPASVAGGAGAVLTNAGETLHQGVEGSANTEWRGLGGTGHGLYAAAAITWLPVARFEGVRTSAVSGFGATSVSGNRLPYAPEVTHTLTFGYRHANGIDVQFESQHVGAQFGDDLNTIVPTPDGQRGRLDAYTYLGVAASAPLPRVPGRIFVTVKNLADRTFIIDRVRGILPAHPRLIHVGTSWRF